MGTVVYLHPDYQGCQLMEKLKRARESAGVSVTELAKQLGIAPAAYRRYERGEVYPKINVCAQICKIIGKSIGEVFDDEYAKVWSPAGCAMRAGSAAHKFINDVVVHDQDQGEAMRHAVSTLDEHKPLEHFPDDNTKFDIIRNLEYKSDITESEGGVFELTLEHLLMGSREAVHILDNWTL